MATRWYQEKKREHYYKQAKRTGYRARSAFKLLQIQKKFEIIKPGDVVVDLGAAPGGWSQVAKKLVGDSGTIVGIDLLPIDPIMDVTFLKGDMTDGSSIQKIIETVGCDKIDVVLSDMSPDISGNYSVDQAKSIYLCQQAFRTAETLLKPGGNFVCKAFQGEDLQDIVIKIKEKFKTVKHFSPPASRKSSSEIYIIARFLKNNQISREKIY
jgi:23S rRNA (uridine2552-2'-O)-methyltransferase